jgi:hypothetical protein
MIPQSIIQVPMAELSCVVLEVFIQLVLDVFALVCTLSVPQVPIHVCNDALHDTIHETLIQVHLKVKLSAVHHPDVILSFSGGQSHNGLKLQAPADSTCTNLQDIA